MATKRASGVVPAVARAGAILGELAQAGGVPLSVSELARRLGLPKSSTANLCLALEAERLVGRDESGYSLGRRLAELGGAYLSSMGQVKAFYRACREQPNVSHETVRAAVLEGLDVLYLARYDGSAPIRLTANIGDRFPAHCTATGKALLAQMDNAVVLDRLRHQRELVALTERSITDPAALIEDLERVRENGYAVDDEETSYGVICWAIAIPNMRPGGEAFAISVTILKAALSESRRPRLLDELRVVGKALENPMIPEL